MITHIEENKTSFIIEGIFSFYGDYETFRLECNRKTGFIETIGETRGGIFPDRLLSDEISEQSIREEFSDALQEDGSYIFI